MTVSHRKPNTNASLPVQGGPGTRFHCDVCSRDVTNTVRIRCASETCKDYDLCVPCFTNGESTGAHQPDHPYQVIEISEYPIFDEEWGADEELALVEGLEGYGLGNWADVAGGLGREKEDVEKHYLNTFVMTETFPVPNMKRKFNVPREELAARKKARLQQPPPPLKPPQKPLVSNPACHEIAGYLPGRLDFDIEYENEAELSVKDLQFEPDAGEGEIDLKLTILDIYNSRLTARAERKRVMFEHNLVDYRKNSVIEKRRAKDEREIVNKAKVFARLMKRIDYEKLIEGLLEEVRLRREIHELQEWRRNGITTMDQGAKYARDKVQRATLLRLQLPQQVTVTPRPKPSLDPADIPGKPHKRNSNPLDVSNAADVHLLTNAEQSLCAQLRLMPKPYMAIKETFSRELMRNGGNLKRRQIRDLMRVDFNKLSRVFDFFQANKWIGN